MKEMPLTVRRSIELLGVCAIGLLIIWGQTVVMPLLFALFVSILVLPLFRWFVRRKIPESLAILLSILALFIVIAGIGVLLSWQIGTFISDIDTIKKNITVHWNNISSWVSRKTDYSVDQQMNLLKEQGRNFGANITEQVQGAMASLSGIFIFLGLLPIYIFLILYYRNLLLKFVYLWFTEDQHPK